MPQLPAPVAQQAEANAGESFEALQPGVYTATLAEVKADKSSGQNPMWVLKFNRILDSSGNKKPGSLWTNLVIMESTMWKVGMFFNAFGVPTTTNTDNMVGYRCRITVSKRIIEQGQRKGQEGNDITGFSMLFDDDQGYAEIQQLKAKTGGGATKAAPAKAAPKAAAPAPDEAQAQEPAAAAAAAAPAAKDPWAGGPEEGGGVDF